VGVGAKRFKGKKGDKPPDSPLQCYGGWAAWLVCLSVAVTFLVGSIVDKFLANVRRLSASLSPLRRVFGVLSLIAIPYMATVGFGEQAASPMNPQGPVLWFTAAAVNAVIFFWICEELITTQPLLRKLFLLSLGILVILALRHQVNWAMAEAEHSAQASEIKDSREGLAEANNWKFFHQQTKCVTVVTASKKQEQPDISMRLVYPQSISFQFLNKSRVVIREPKWTPVFGISTMVILILSVFQYRWGTSFLHMKA